MALVLSTLSQQHSAALASARVVSAVVTTTMDADDVITTVMSIPAVSNLAEGDVAGYQAFVDGLDEIAADMEAIIAYEPA